MIGRLRWALIRRWRTIRHLGRDFTVVERSPEADGLTQQWTNSWANAEPLGSQLRDAYPERWVRFWSLPDGKRYADTDAERTIILERHLAVLAKLGAPTSVLLVIAEEFGPEDTWGGWSRAVLPHAWPWRIYTELDDPEFPPTSRYFWVEQGPSTDLLSHLLELAADDRADFILSPPDLAWIYAPYDGGVDVILPDQQSRDALRRSHPDWLSDRDDGL